MPNCISCGRAIEEGKFFCADCYETMTPGAVTEQAPAAPAPGRGEPAGGASASVAPAAAAPEAPSFTPPSEKRVIKSAPTPPGKKVKTAKKAKDPGAKPVKAAKAVKAAKPAKQPKPPREGPSRVEVAGLKTRQAGKRLGHWLKGAAARSALWLKGMALESKGDFDQADWIAWGVGAAASLLLIAAVILMGFVRLDWILSGSEAIETQSTVAKGINLGAWGYMLAAISVILALLYLLSFLVGGTKLKIRVNPAFLAICISVIGLVVLILALWSNGSIMHAVAKKNGWSETQELAYAKKTVLYGAYIAVACLVVTFGAAAVRLAEREASPQWIRRITSWFKVKMITMGKSGKAGKSPHA